MRKLSRGRLLDLLSCRGSLSAYRAGKRFGVCARHVRRLWERFECEGLWERRKPGFAPKCFEEWEVEAVRKAYARVKVGAVSLESVLERDGVYLSHNRIHSILRELGKAKREPSKSARRKWIRFQRRKSNSLWHVDWTKLGKKWLVALLDDASRFIVGYGLFDSPTVENSVLVMRAAIAQYGVPKALLSGHDVQFYASAQKGVPSEPNAFQKLLAEQKIKHVLARVNHPQTNGKLERWFGTLKRKLHEFNNINELVHWYNNIRPHMSLDWNKLETPAQAYLRKGAKPKQQVLIYAQTKTQRGQ